MLESKDIISISLIVDEYSTKRYKKLGVLVRVYNIIKDEIKEYILCLKDCTLI